MFVVRQEGLEPPPLGLEGRCSIQLSYCRVADDPRFYLIERARGPITGPASFRLYQVGFKPVADAT